VPALLASYKEDPRTVHAEKMPLPSREAVASIVEDMLDLLFPGYFRLQEIDEATWLTSVSDILVRVTESLGLQILRAFRHEHTCYEGKKMALQIEKEWKTISKDEISNVGFSEWYAGNLSYHLSNRPKVFLEENNKFYKKPAVIIAKDIGPSLCNRKNINVKNIVYKKIDNHDVCFIF
jgi:hypothetical protein